MRYTALLTLLAVSACGTSTESFTVNGQEVTRAEIEELTGGGPLVAASDDPVSFALISLEDDIAASGLRTRSNSSFATVTNATGAATFTGIMDIETRGVPGREYNIQSQADITVDFDADTLTTTFGEATVLNRDNEVVANPTNNLVVANGEIGNGRANAVSLEVSGSLSAQGFLAVVQGDLEGSLRGTPIVGLVASDTSPLIIVDGVSTPSGSITLEAVADP